MSLRKHQTGTFIRGSVVVLASLAIMYGIARAGSLTPTSAPAATSYTLNDIYTRLTTNATTTAGSHVFSPSASPAGTLYTLTQVYGAIPTIDAAKVLTGTSYLGVAGTAYGDIDPAKILTTASTAGTYDATNLTVGNVKSGVTFGVANTGTLTPDGGTATVADLFNGQTANLTADWTLDTGTLNLACNTATFDGTGNLVPNAYDGAGLGNNRWCMTDSGTAVAGDLLSGKIAWVDGVAITGTIPTQTLSAATTTVSAGYYNATTLTAVDSDLAVGNIRSGITLFGINGDSNVVNTSSGDAIAGDLFNGKIAWVDGASLTGTLNLACNTATFDGTANLVPNAYDGAGLGNNRWCMTDSGTAVAGDLLSGKIAWVDGVAVTGTVPAGANVTGANGALTMTIPNGLYAGSETATASDTNLTAGNILSGVTIFGTTGTLISYTYGDNNASKVGVTATAPGTLLANLFNGTGQGVTGGSQANGGIDDYNKAGSPPTDRYAKSWTACNAGNTYCGTADVNAKVKDDSTGLVWSLACGSSGISCTPTNETTPTTYTWANAVSACSNMTGWSLPHQKQLMQAYIDGAYGNLEAAGVNRFYWSATTHSNITTNAWTTNLSDGYTNYSANTGSTYVRCVR